MQVDSLTASTILITSDALEYIMRTLNSLICILMLTWMKLMRIL